MSLREQQSEFVLQIAGLIAYASSIGLELTFGDAYRDPRAHGGLGIKMGYGHKNSCHKLRLAVDFNVFRDGKLAEMMDYDLLHDYWDTVGGARRIDNDLNHFSFQHGEMR
jgi:hypothetical protein